MHLAASLQRVHQIAIGRIPPLFFCRAMRVAPKKYGRMTRGVWPSRIKVSKPNNARNNRCAPSPADWPLRSLRCWGRRPSKPPPEPLGKDAIDLMIDSKSTGKGRGLSKSCRTMLDSEDASALRVMTEWSAMVSSLHAIISQLPCNSLPPVC
jgi:hypothetical protein